MLIPSRIKAIGDFINDGECVADVGADHGLLEIYLLAKYRNARITAIENKKGPFEILDISLRGYKNVELSFSDGLDAVGENINTVVLAGMGGLNIIKILEKNKEKLAFINKIIVDAHRDSSLVRKELVNLGYKIEKEKIVYEQDKYYVIIEFVKSETHKKYSKDEIEFGYQIYKDELWPKYKVFLTRRIQNLRYKIQNKPSCKKQIEKLEKVEERLRNYGKD